MFKSKPIVLGLVILFALILVVAGCSERSAVVFSDPTPDPPDTIGIPVDQVTCEICGECTPLYVEVLYTTLIYCPGECCNGLGVSFKCATGGEDFLISVNECVFHEWMIPDDLLSDS